MRSTTVLTASGDASGRTSANSSPPIRNASSERRSASTRIRPSTRSTSSPARCPCESFSSLKRSRSQRTRPKGSPERSAREASASRRSMKTRRFRRRVSGSWSARKRSSWTWSTSATAVALRVEERSDVGERHRRRERLVAERPAHGRLRLEPAGAGFGELDRDVLEAERVADALAHGLEDLVGVEGLREPRGDAKQLLE